MTNPNKLGDVIRTIVQEHGEAALLDLSFTMAAVADLAPALNKEAETLRALLLCDGAEKLLQIRNATTQEQSACLENLVRRMQDEQWVTESAARNTCGEFYRGLTGNEWNFASGESRNGSQATNLNVYKSVTIRDPKKAAGNQISFIIDGRTAKVQLPDNLTDGQLLCFPKNGRQDAARGVTGDLYVTVRIAKLPPYRKWLKFVGAATAAVVLVSLLFSTGGNSTQDPQGNEDHSEDSVQNQTVAHTHDWQDADCTSPRTCISCGETDGSALGHQWQEANCIMPRTCTVCGETSGAAADHHWIAASYSSPAYCDVCGITDGLSLGMPVIKCKVLGDSQSSKKTDIITGTLTDEAGNRYEDAVKFWVVRAAGLYSMEHIVYDLSGKYDLLQGVIAVEKGSAAGAAVRFYIYGDGELLFKSRYISGTELENVELDVSGVKELRIECETDETCHSYGLLQAALYVK